MRNGNFCNAWFTGGNLNAPWGIALAPGRISGYLEVTILIGNFGNGQKSNAFNPTTGKLHRDA